MKTTKPEHAQIDATVAGIPAAEPVFLLRAQDVHAQAAVRFYADRVQAAGGDQNTISAARQSVTDFAAWPVKKEPTFEPDAPAEAPAGEAPVDPLTPGAAIETTVTEQPRRRSREA